MTHNDIYTKFMIEYDKANVTSSYPSLTEYEVATILDKAYLTLIAKKLTGNNTRRVPFEYDVKAVEDLRPLVTTKSTSIIQQNVYADNEFVYKFPDDILYYLEGRITYGKTSSNAADDKLHDSEVVTLSDHNTAQKFKATNSNIPWIKQPLSFLEEDGIHVLIDTYKHDHIDPVMFVTYMKKPASFVSSLIITNDSLGDDLSSLNNDLSSDDQSTSDITSLPSGSIITTVLSDAGSTGLQALALTVYCKNCLQWPYEIERLLLSDGEWFAFRSGELSTGNYQTTYNGVKYDNATGYYFYYESKPYYIRFIVYNNSRTAILFLTNVITVSKP